MRPHYAPRRSHAARLLGLAALALFACALVMRRPAPSSAPTAHPVHFAQFEALGHPFQYAVEGTLHSAQFIERYERGIAAGMARELAKTPNCTLLDVGANGGYYALLALALGCRAIAVDAQPLCLKRARQAARASHFSKLHTVWGAIQAPGSPRVKAGEQGCSGLWSAVFEGDRNLVNGESQTTVEVPSITLADVVAGFTVTTMKIDVEGSDMAVLQQALPLLFEPRVVRDVYVEVWGAEGAALESYMRVFRAIVAAGYRVADERATPLSLVAIRQRLGATKRPGDWWIQRI
jgi:FkbM family methyltransferase